MCHLCNGRMPTWLKNTANIVVNMYKLTADIAIKESVSKFNVKLFFEVLVKKTCFKWLAFYVDFTNTTVSQT